MKTTMKNIILMIVLISGCSEKENIEPENNCLNCESELNKEDIQNLTCKVAKFNDTTYILTYDSISLIDSGYVIGSNFILVPCELPDSLKIPETKVEVSGQIVKDCCNLLTLPQIRGGFGCKFYITEIKKLKNDIVYPIDVNVNDFSLQGTTCNWQNMEQDTIYILNSTEELIKYTSCQEDIPAIDFDKYSLLLANGGTPSWVFSISRHLQQTSLNEYKLMIDITMDMTTLPGVWHIAILTPKLSSSAEIELEIKQHR